MFTTLFQGDARAVRGALRGDRSAFNGLVERHLPMVYAQAYAQTRCREDALDITQDVFLKAFQTLDTLKEPGSFPAWLRSIARNRATDYLRRRQREAEQRRAEGESEPAATPDPGREELLALLRQQITQLEESYREVILLYYFSGQNLPQVARSLSISPNAAKKRLHRARQTLGDRLTAEITGLLENERPTRDHTKKIMASIAAAGATWLSSNAAAAGTGILLLWKPALALIAFVAVGGAGAYLILYDSVSTKLALLASPGTAGVTSAPPPVAVLEKVEDEGAVAPAESNASEVEVAPPAEGNLRGIVIDEDGAPVSGALVWAAATMRPMEARKQTSGEDGSFSFELDPDWWMIRARVNDRSGTYSVNNGMVNIKEDNTAFEGVIRIEPQGSLRGRILDIATQQPVPNAALWFDEGILVKASGQGAYSVHGLTTANHYAYVIAPGYERKRILFDTSLRRDAQLDCFVYRAGRLRGRVTDERGNPVKGAYVHDPGSGSMIAEAARYAQVSADGSYVRDGLVFGPRYNFVAGAPGYLESQQRIEVSPENPDVETHFVLRENPDKKPEARLNMAEKAARRAQPPLPGIVRDPSGKPVAGAKIKRNSLGGGLCGASGSDGHFELPGHVRDDEAVGVIAEGFAPVLAGMNQSRLEITLQPGHFVAGVVLDSAGKPLEDVMVIPTIARPSPGSPRTWLEERSARTDAEGRYRIDALPNEPVRFDFLKLGFSALREQELVLNSGENVHTLLAGGAVRGRVVDTAGRPVRQFNVTLKFIKGGFFAGFQGIGVDYTTDDGVFVLSDVDAGSIFGMTIAAPGYRDGGRAEVSSHPLNELPEADQLQFVLEPLSASSVQVVGPEGNPIEGARVVLTAKDPGESFLWGEDDQRWERVIRYIADRDGRVVIDNGGMSKGTLLVRADGFARQRLAWPLDSSELTIAMVPEAILEGTFPNFANLPEDGGRVAISRGNEWLDAFVVQRDGDGRFRFDGLPAGVYNLVLPLPGGQKTPIPPSDPALPDDIRAVVAGGSLHHTVNLAEGEVLVLGKADLLGSN